LGAGAPQCGGGFKCSIPHSAARRQSFSVELFWQKQTKKNRRTGCGTGAPAPFEGIIGVRRNHVRERTLRTVPSLHLYCTTPAEKVNEKTVNELLNLPPKNLKFS
jgi:hypothetical protein